MTTETSKPTAVQQPSDKEKTTTINSDVFHQFILPGTARHVKLVDSFSADAFANALRATKDPFTRPLPRAIVHRLVETEKNADLLRIAELGGFQGQFARIMVKQFRSLPSLQQVQELSQSPELEGAFRTIDFFEFLISCNAVEHLLDLQSRHAALLDLRNSCEMSFSEALVRFVQRTNYLAKPTSNGFQSDIYDILKPMLLQQLDQLQKTVDMQFQKSLQTGNLKVVRRFVEDFGVSLQQTSPEPASFLSTSFHLEYESQTKAAQQTTATADQTTDGFLKSVDQLALYLRVFKRAEQHALCRETAAVIANSSPLIATSYANGLVRTAEEALDLVAQLDASNQQIMKLRL